MNFQEAEKTYQDLRAQYSAGKLNNADFEAEVSKLKVQDAEGRWWQIGVQSGDWYVHDGQKWSKSKPPALTAAPAVAAPPSENPVTAPTVAPVAPNGPKAAGNGPKTAPAKGAVTGKLAPRFFSSAPAGRGTGGLPTPVLIGIIGAVAVIGIVLIVVAYFVISGQGKGSGTPVAGTPRTPTTVAVVAPTSSAPLLPTLPPPPPTNPPVVVPTVATTPTVAITATVAATSTVAISGTASTPAAPRATATKKPAPTVAGPTATKVPNVPPGVYVTGLRLNPAKVDPGTAVTFAVTFLNTTNNLGPTPWLVKIFRCEAACTADELKVNRSVGETPRTSANIIGGTTELSVGMWTFTGGGCNYVASPYYIDPSTGQVLPFPTTSGGDRLYFNFKTCQ